MEALDGLLDAVREGQSRVLVVRGISGVGKSALLDYVAERAAGCRLARAAGVQSEMELPFAGLHQLCGPMLDRLDALPTPQRDALSVAFGLSAGDPPDRFLIGIAVLGLLSEIAVERPLVCLVDDSQWLDHASAHALTFVGRRLLAESVALVFAARRSGADEPLAGLPELAIEGLRDSDARALLRSGISWSLDERVQDRIVAETRGNPLALIELPWGLGPAELAGGFGVPDVRHLPGRIEDSFRRRLQQLPIETQLLLLAAAADPVGDPALMWRVAARLGIPVEAADAADSEGLVEFSPRVVFRHPLVRSAIYWAAPLEQRREVHGALANATDPERDPDRRAWHRAQATSGPDAEVAAELEHSAERAHSRGGLAAAAAFLERSAALTPEPQRRAERALNAARTNAQAGALDAALRLLATAEVGPLNELQCAQAELLRAQIAFAVNRGRDAPPLLLTAAKRLGPLDVGLTRETYLEALQAAMFVGRLATAGGLAEVARAARKAPATLGPPRATDLLLDGLALLNTEGYPAGTSTLRQALGAFCRDEITSEEGLRWLWLACRAAVDLWDYESWYLLSARHLELARNAGALAVLPAALISRMAVHLWAGELASAASLIEEVETVTDATGSHLAPYGPIALAAWRGRDAEVSHLIETSMNEVVSRGEGQGLALIDWTSAVLYNGLGRYQDALAPAHQAAEHPEELPSAWGLVELIEASARTGNAARGADALRRLSTTTRASGTEWALGVEARSRALLNAGEEAEALYREAIERLGRTRVRVELARARLLYGEWLRREHRRLEAREELRSAYEMFVAMGAQGFATRAERELLATGETARERTVETSRDLTAQEAQVARLAREGLSNSEIGGRLFISSRTVQYHLHKVFTKLGITSRTQLERVLPSETPTS